MLKPETRYEIPPETRKVAKAAFPKGNIFIRLRDELGVIFEDELFADLYSGTGQPAESPARLAFVTLMQYVENLTDRQAADAVRGRIDWKYVLGLELDDPGFDYSVLSEFRLRLLQGGAEQQLLDKLLERCAERGFLDGRKKQRTDSTHVMAAIRNMNLLELVGETMRRALDELARGAPEWLQNQIRPEWLKRYEHRFENYRLPKGKEKREELAVAIGMDGQQLLTAIYFDPQTPEDLKKLPTVEALRRIWVQQYYLCDGKVYWRTKKKWGQPAAGKMISSPDDLEARYCVKRTTEWTGYKVHLTETCDPKHPHLITQVETTVSTQHDVKATGKIQDELITKGLKPNTHLVDEGYMEADLLVSSQKKGIDLFGPVPSSKSWQDREEDAFDHSQFTIDWDNMQAHCPGGKTSTHWSARKTRRGTKNLVFTFRRSHCQACEQRSKCTRAKNVGRTLTIYHQATYETLQQARQRQETDEFKKVYDQRSGVEGTISQGVRSLGMRRSRYIGLARTRLQHVATAAAINIVRIFHWLQEGVPRRAYVPPFVQLAAQM
jgi:transposase